MPTPKALSLLGFFGIVSLRVVRIDDTLRPIIGQIDAVPFHLCVEQLAMDVEHPRGFRTVTAGPAKGATYQQFLQSGDGCRQVFVRPIETLAANRRRLVKETKMHGIDAITAHQHRRTLHRILQLAHVAGPRMTDQPGGGLGGKTFASGLLEEVIG
jgi:hypothetical protein